MGTEYIVRRARSEDVSAMMALIGQCLGESSPPCSHDHWHWKHVNSPFGSSPCLVAEANGQLIGLRAFMRWTWCHAGRKIKAVRAVDTATHPDWRGKGIFKTLTLQLADQMHNEGVSLVFNTPNESSRMGYLSMGWKSIGRSTMWIKPVRPARLARAVVKGVRSNGSRRAPIPDGMANFATLHTVVDTTEFDRLLGSLPIDDGRLAVEPTSAYYRWRYATIPGISYRAAYVFDGRDAAVVVFGITRDGSLLTLRLCDLLIGPTRRSQILARQLVKQVVAASDCDYAVAIAGWGTPEAGLLPGCGFVPVPRLGPLMVVRPLDMSPLHVDPLRRSSWRLSIGALELF